MSGFVPDFYRAFVQNGLESPTRLEPVRVVQHPFRVYLKTEDSAGRPIGEPTLDMTERVLGEAAWTWSGELFGISEIVRGTGSRESMPGWITVSWSAASPPDRCGTSTVGIDGGTIAFNATGLCSCGLPTLIYPRLVRHELGHAMGYYHTDGADDEMFGRTIDGGSCDTRPSERERIHAKIAHQSTP